MLTQQIIAHESFESLKFQLTLDLGKSSFDSDDMHYILIEFYS